MNKIINNIRFSIESIVNSYSQIFFSNNKIFALLLIIVTFFDFWAGLSGVVAISISNVFAYFIGLNRDKIISGFYGFNSLLVGLGLGAYFNPNFEFYIMLAFASLLTVFVAIVLQGVLGKYHLPFLSLPFFFAILMVTLASRGFKSLEISERGIYAMNEMYNLGGSGLLNSYEWFNRLNWHESIVVYFKSLGGIFFQYHLFAGIIIAIGLLYYSRIAFMLSFIGFYSAYFYYHFIGANIQELSYNYIGFNYILTAIAIGGFFIIPSKTSFLWVLLITPIISFFITSTTAIFSIFQLPIYSLPFNAAVIIFLYILKFRERNFNHPELVALQQYSPEKNLYIQYNNRERFKNLIYFPISLPISEEWKITQAHNGKHTHKNEWRHAWDFELTDEYGNLFNNLGNVPDDYFSFNKPIYAPADAWVEEVLDGIEDNQIGEVNLEHNWGNTIVLRHSNFLYTKLSHLRKGSIKINKGDFVKKGELIAFCGNSGRSPQPHLHFQIQATPYIGSKTIDYPIAHYIKRKGKKFSFCSFEKPNEKDYVSNIKRNPAIFKALNFVPGQKLSFSIQKDNVPNAYIESWEICVDMHNHTYIYDSKSHTYAYYHFDGELFYFTHFSGNKKSLLYHFYLGAYKLITGFYKDMVLDDVYPLVLNHNRFILTVQDFIAPFYIFLKSTYHAKYIKKKEYFHDIDIEIETKSEKKFFNFTTNSRKFKLEIKNNRIDKMTFYQNKNKNIATWVPENIF